MRITLLVLLSLPTLLPAAPLISSTVSCSVPDVGYTPEHGGPVVSSTTNPCSVESDYVSSPQSATYAVYHQFAQAHVITSYTQSLNGFNLDFSVLGFSTPAGTASAALLFTDTYTTDGPIRAGTVRGLFQPIVGRYGGFAQYSLSYPGQLGPNPGYGAGAMPFILGQPFTVTASVVARSLSDDGTQSWAQVTGPLQLSFFEADGVTPVHLTEVPEPTSYALLSIGIIGLPLAVRGRRKR